MEYIFFTQIWFYIQILFECINYLFISIDNVCNRVVQGILDYSMTINPNPKSGNKFGLINPKNPK